MFTFWQLVKKWTTFLWTASFFEWRRNLMRWQQNWCSVKNVGKRTFDLVHFLRVGTLIFRNFFKNCWIVSLRKTWLKKNVFWEICSSWLVKVTIQFANANRGGMNNFTAQRNMSTHAILMTQKKKQIRLWMCKEEHKYSTVKEICWKKHTKKCKYVAVLKI